MLNNMIKVNLKYNDDVVDSILVCGHAGYDVYGKDIVCASVSCIVITSVNALLRIDNDSISYTDDDGLHINVLKHDFVIDTIIENMICLLYDLEKQYNKNIIINKEVCSC